MSIKDKLLALVAALTNSRDDQALVDELSATDEVPMNLAVATLLVDLALIDAQFDAREYDFVMSSLRKTLNIDEDEAKRLVQSASTMIQIRGSHSFAVELQKRLPLERRQQIAAELGKLMLADKQEDGFETYLVRKLRDVLGVNRT